MTIPIAETPKEFRQKIIELQATSIVYKRGNDQDTFPIGHRTADRIEEVFNDCVCKAVDNSPQLTRIPVFLEAHKNGNPVITAKWFIVRVPMP
jgi:hypothetical protein